MAPSNSSLPWQIFRVIGYYFFSAKEFLVFSTLCDDVDVVAEFPTSYVTGSHSPPHASSESRGWGIVRTPGKKPQQLL